MIGWWVTAGAVVIALVVLGFCARELLWRVRRIQRDAHALAELGPEITAVGRGLQTVAIRSSTIHRDAAAATTAHAATAHAATVHAATAHATTAHWTTVPSTTAYSTTAQATTAGDR